MKTKSPMVSKIISLFSRGSFWVHKKYSHLVFKMRPKHLTSGFTYKPLRAVKIPTRNFDVFRNLKSLLSPHSPSLSPLFRFKSVFKNKVLKNLKPSLSFWSRFVVLPPRFRPVFLTLLILIVLFANTLVFVRGVSAEKGYFPLKFFSTFLNGFGIEKSHDNPQIAGLALSGNVKPRSASAKQLLESNQSFDVVLGDSIQKIAPGSSSSNITLQNVTTNGASTSQNLSLLGKVYFGSGIEVKGSAKLQKSADVEGNLTVGTEALHVDTTNDQVGIGTKYPKHKLDVAGNVKVGQELIVIKDAHLYNDLTVDGQTELTGILNANGGIETDGDKFILDGKRGDVETAGTIRVHDQAWLNSNVSLGNDSSDTLETNARVGSSFIPKATNTYDLGASSLYWNNIYARNLFTSGTITASGNILPGATDTYDLGSSSARWNNLYAKNINSSGTTTSTGNIIPGADNTYSLGSSLYRWKDLYLGPASLKIYNSIGANAEYATLGFSSNVATLNVTRDGSGTYRPFAINQNGSEAIRITGGNVGIGTTSPSAKLDIVGSADTTQLKITANSTQSNTNPIIKVLKSDGVTELFRLHSDHITNLFIGTDAGNANTPIGTSGEFDYTHPEGLFNTFIGRNAGHINTIGNRNTAVGSQSMLFNVSGSYNAAVGYGALRINTEGSRNTAMGEEALMFNTTGNYNSAVGMDALEHNDTGSYNSVLGFNALALNDTGSYNSAVGVRALAGNSEGNYNTAIGSDSLYYNVTGDNNTGIGFDALYTNRANSNTAIGAGSMYSNNTGTYNTGVGMYSLYSSTGSNNTAIGFDALYRATGNYNTAIGTSAGEGVAASSSISGNSLFGYRAGYGLLTNADYNTLLGFKAGDNLTTGKRNVIIGYDLDAPTETSSYTLSIGNLIFGTGLNGTGTTPAGGNVGIGTTTPQSKLQVNGYIQMNTNNDAPAAADCDSDLERGRMILDYTNNRLYVCNGATRGWDYIALTD